MLFRSKVTRKSRNAVASRLAKSIPNLPTFVKWSLVRCGIPPAPNGCITLYWRGCFANCRDTKRMATSPDYLKLVESKTRALADAASNSPREIADAGNCRLEFDPKLPTQFLLHCTSNAAWEHAASANLSLPITHAGFSLRCVEGFRQPTSPYRVWD